VNQLVRDLLDDYDKVSKEVDGAVSSSPQQLATAVEDHINSLDEVSDAQVVNLLRFLEHPNLPPLVRHDCVRELSKGPARGKLVSSNLALLLGKHVHIAMGRDRIRKDALKRMRFIDRVEDLPEFLSHRDLKVVEAAEERFKYLQSFPERAAALAREIEIKEKRRQLAKEAGDYAKLAEDVNFPEEDRLRMEQRAAELYAASMADDQTVLFFEK